MPRWKERIITKIEKAAPETWRFWMETPQEEAANFIPGQFVTMDLPIGEKRLDRWRSYSIANAPNGGTTLEFCIVHLEGGNASDYFFTEVKPGTVIKYKGPAGTFTLPEKIETDLVFICTGTGVAPFRSMIWDLYKTNRTERKIHLIFGTRYENGILYREEFEKLAAEWPQFEYSITLSRDREWGGHIGYVHHLYNPRYKEVREDIIFYLCGWTNMVDEAKESLIVEMGYDPKQIKVELYG